MKFSMDRYAADCSTSDRDAGLMYLIYDIYRSMKMHEDNPLVRSDQEERENCMNSGEPRPLERYKDDVCDDPWQQEV